MDFTEIAARCHRIAVEHGFWEQARNVPEALCLIHSEISEALEEFRQDGNQYRQVGEKPEGFAVELADAVIRILDLTEGLGIDLEAFLIAKLAYNETREYKHGKRF